MDWALPAELAVNGALVGLMYSLVAMGIVLIYKSSSVPNLAQGAMTMLGAYVVLAFAEPAGVPIWLAIPLGDRDHVRRRHRHRAGRAAPARRPADRHDPDDDPGPRDLPARRLDDDLGRHRAADAASASATLRFSSARMLHQPRLCVRRGGRAA